jgi:hypothetical protein
LLPPLAPTLSQVAGGSLGARTYYVKITYKNLGGETTASGQSALAISANYLLYVTSPVASGNATHYNVYASTVSGSETKQNTNPVLIGADWTEPVSGLISGAALPSANTTALYVDTAPGIAVVNGVRYPFPSVISTAVSPSITTYFFVSTSGALSSNDTGYLAGSIPLAKAVSNATTITALDDDRSILTGVGIGGGGGITSLNGLTATTQYFATPGTSGTAPNWSSVTDTHTLNIPLAATASVTAGLISKSEFDIFNNKQDALGFTPENSANKNAASGYAGLTSGTKLTLAQGQEVWAAADLSDLAGLFGTAAGTKAVTTALTGDPTTNNCVKWVAGGQLGDAGAACGSGGTGDNISVNGTAATDADFDDATPAAPANAINVKWQKDALTPNNLSAYLPYTAPLTVTAGNLDCVDASGSAKGCLTSANWTTFNGKQDALGFTPENSANKNAASGYAGLTASTKLNAAQGQEVWALADLTDVSAVTGAGSTVMLNQVPVLYAYTVAGLPAAGTAGRVAVVTDAATAGSCTSGSGSSLALCRDSASAWVPLGDGGGGGGTRSVHAMSWFFPGTPATGVQNLRLTFPDGAITNIAILDMRVTVNTVSAASSTFNIQRCVVSGVACSATESTWVDIYSTVLTLAASNYKVAKGSAPNQNVGSLVPGDQFRANLVTIGASLADVTVTMTYKYDTQN